MSAALLLATQSAAGKPPTLPAYSHQPLPSAHESPKPMMGSPFLHVVTKLAGPTTLYLLVPSESTMPWMDTTPAIRPCTPQLCVFTPPGPTLAATSKAT